MKFLIVASNIGQQMLNLAKTGFLRISDLWKIGTLTQTRYILWNEIVKNSFCCSEYVLIVLGNPIIFLPFQPDMSVMEYLAKPEIIDDQHCELKHKMRPWWARIQFVSISPTKTTLNVRLLSLSWVLIWF